MKKEFNLEKYIEENKTVIKMIKETLPNWKKNQGFIADGLINSEVYSKQKIKIICFLSESYGWANNCMVDIQKQRRKGQGKEAKDNDILGLLNSKSHTARNLSSFLFLVYDFFDNKKKMSQSDFKNHKLLTSNITNNIKLQDTLEKTAWINIKKLSENKSSRANNDDIRKHASINKKILKKQIEITNPDIIFIFSEVVKSSLCEMNLLGNINNLSKNKLTINDIGQKILYLNHPSTWYSYDSIYQTFDNFYNEFLEVK